MITRGNAERESIDKPLSTDCDIRGFSVLGFRITFPALPTPQGFCEGPQGPKLGSAVLPADGPFAAKPCTGIYRARTITDFLFYLNFTLI